jgi:hypothetical protein
MPSSLGEVPRIPLPRTRVHSSWVAFLVTHHHNRAVGVLDDAARDAPHERPAYPALASAAHNYQACAQLLGQQDDLVVRSSHLEVSLSDLSPAS